MSMSDELSFLALPPEGIEARELVRSIAKVPRSTFLEECSSYFLLQVPAAADAAEQEEIDALADRMTRPLGRTQILNFERAKDLEGARVHAFLPAERGLVVGAEEGVDILLHEPSVSARHAELHYGERGWQVFDLESTNGTFVEGDRVGRDVRQPLASGKKIYFASYRALFLASTQIYHMARHVVRRMEKTGE